MQLRRILPGAPPAAWIMASSLFHCIALLFTNVHLAFVDNCSVHTHIPRNTAAVAYYCAFTRPEISVRVVQELAEGWRLAWSSPDIMQVACRCRCPRAEGHSHGSFCGCRCAAATGHCRPASCKAQVRKNELWIRFVLCRILNGGLAKYLAISGIWEYLRRHS
jgi:hypothetical protein